MTEKLSIRKRISWAFTERPRQAFWVSMICLAIEAYLLYLLIWMPEWWVESRRFSLVATWLAPVVVPVAYVWGLATMIDNAHRTRR